MHVVFTGFLAKLTNMIIKIQSTIYMNAQKLTLDSVVTLISDIWMSTGTLELVIRKVSGNIRKFHFRNTTFIEIILSH